MCGSGAQSMSFNKLVWLRACPQTDSEQFYHPKFPHATLIFTPPHNPNPRQPLTYFCFYNFAFFRMLYQ